jgi:hypothetical protein
LQSFVATHQPRPVKIAQYLFFSYRTKVPEYVGYWTSDKKPSPSHLSYISCIKRRYFILSLRVTGRSRALFLSRRKDVKSTIFDFYTQTYTGRMFYISVNPTKRIRHSCSAWNFVFASVVGHRFRFRKCALILKTVYWLMHGKSFSIAQQTAKVGPVSARECRWSMTELWLRASPAAKLAERHPFPDHILPYGWRVASLGQWYSKENCAISSVWLYATFYVVDSEISSEQSFKIGCMTLCPFFVFLK